MRSQELQLTREQVTKMLDLFRALVTKYNKIELNNTRRDTFVAICTNPDATYQEIGAKLGLTEDSIRFAAKDIFAILNETIVLQGQVKKRNFRTLAIPELLKYIDEPDSKNSQILPTQQNTNFQSLTNSSIANKHPELINSDSLDLSFERQFYIEPKIHQEAFKELSKPGGIIRIIGPKNAGKTLLLESLLDRISDSTLGMQIDLNLVDEPQLEDANLFTRWLCEFIALQLQLPLNTVEENWIESLGGLTSATNYFEAYLLKTIDRPLILAFDSLKRLFAYESSAKKIFQMLRAWGDKRSRSQIWREKFRLILAYRKNPLSLERRYSPFNIGVPIYLSEFSTQEALELSSRHKLSLKEEDVKNLISEIGSNPYLIHSVFKELKRSKNTLNSFLESDYRNKEPFEGYLKDA